MTNKTKEKRYVIITPYRIAFDRFCVDHELNPRNQIWVSNNDSIYKTYGIELTEEDVVLLHEWYLISDAQKVFDRVRSKYDLK